MLITASFKGQKLVFQVEEDTTWEALGAQIAASTGVSLASMKLTGPRLKGAGLRPASNPSQPVRDSGLRDGDKVMILGSSSAAIAAVQATHDAPGILGIEEEMLRTARRRNLRPGGTTPVQLPVGPYTFARFTALDNLPHARPGAGASLQLLHRLAADPGIVGIMQQNRFEVGLLSEMPPTDFMDDTRAVTCLLGLNVNAGQEIKLRLRTNDLLGFRKYDKIRETLVHELTHNVWGDHDNNFKTLNSQLLRECVRLSRPAWSAGAGDMYQGALGDDLDRLLQADLSSAHGASSSHRLGGRTNAPDGAQRPAVSAAVAAAQAALARVPPSQDVARVYEHHDASTGAEEARMALLGALPTALPNAHHSGGDALPNVHHSGGGALPNALPNAHHSGGDSGRSPPTPDPLQAGTPRAPADAGDAPAMHAGDAPMHAGSATMHAGSATTGDTAAAATAATACDDSAPMDAELAAVEAAHPVPCEAQPVEPAPSNQLHAGAEPCGRPAEQVQHQHSTDSAALDKRTEGEGSRQQRVPQHAPCGAASAASGDCTGSGSAPANSRSRHASANNPAAGSGDAAGDAHCAGQAVQAMACRSAHGETSASASETALGGIGGGAVADQDMADSDTRPAVGRSGPAPAQQMEPASVDAAAADQDMVDSDTRPAVGRPEPAQQMEPVTHSVSGDAAVDERVIAIVRAIQTLQASASRDEVSAALVTVDRIVRNALEHPENERYTRVRRGNTAFWRSVGRLPAAEELLSLAGFALAGGELWTLGRRQDPGMLWLVSSIIREQTAGS